MVMPPTLHQHLIKPKALPVGGTIGIVSPAAPTPDVLHFDQGEALLHQAGYQTKRFSNAANKRHYLAGTDQERHDDLLAAFLDPNIDAILCARGGYGTTRILSKELLQAAQKHPKIVIGFSDITALHVALYERTGLCGFYGPMLTSNLIEEDTYTWDNLFSIITPNKTDAASPSTSYPHLVPNQDADTYQCITSGTASGKVTAPLYIGNLTLLAALCGTPYQPNPAGHILCIEDWKESHYSLDRQFQQLRMAGIFDQIKGLLFCDFSQTALEANQTLTELFDEQFGQLPIPVGYGFSVGHGKHTATLPYGTVSEFNAKTGQLMLLESPVISPQDKT